MVGKNDRIQLFSRKRSRLQNTTIDNNWNYLPCGFKSQLTIAKWFLYFLLLLQEKSSAQNLLGLVLTAYNGQGIDDDLIF